jgi:hypothetical protein
MHSYDGQFTSRNTNNNSTDKSFANLLHVNAKGKTKVRTASAMWNSEKVVMYLERKPQWKSSKSPADGFMHTTNKTATTNKSAIHFVGRK